MDWLIIAAGAVGLLVAAYGFIALTIDAIRRREYLDIALASVVVLVVIWLLVAYGDRLLR